MENLLWFIGGMLFYASIPFWGILGTMVWYKIFEKKTK